MSTETIDFEVFGREVAEGAGRPTSVLDVRGARLAPLNRPQTVSGWCGVTALALLPLSETSSSKPHVGVVCRCVLAPQADPSVSPDVYTSEAIESERQRVREVWRCYLPLF